MKTCDYFGCSKVSCFTCWAIVKETRYRTRETHAKVYPDCAFPFSIDKGSSRYQLILAPKKLQDHLIERMLRRALDPDWDFRDDVSLPETVEPGQELELQRKPQWYNIIDPKGESLDVARTRAIRIPSEGIPVSEIVDLLTPSNRHPTNSRNIFANRAVPVSHVDKNGPSFTHWGVVCQAWKVVTSEIQGIRKESIIMYGHAHAPARAGRQPCSELAPINGWYRNLIRDSIEHEYHPNDESVP